MVNFTKKFYLYKKTQDQKLFTESWHNMEGYIVCAAITRPRMEELNEAGRANVGQFIDVRVRYSMYIPDVDNAAKPEFDDFVKCAETGEEFRIITRPQARRSPDVASKRMRFSVCEIAGERIPNIRGESRFEKELCEAT